MGYIKYIWPPHTPHRKQSNQNLIYLIISRTKMTHVCALLPPPHRRSNKIQIIIKDERAHAPDHNIIMDIKHAHCLPIPCFFFYTPKTSPKSLFMHARRQRLCYMVTGATKKSHPPARPTRRLFCLWQEQHFFGTQKHIYNFY